LRCDGGVVLNNKKFSNLKVMH